jgi:glyoxylase-like metal-dependent hydrolase (beta-lactamase superfamily II)
MPDNLARYDPSLTDICFIEGIGLCSNTYVFKEDSAISLVDTGSGIPPNQLSPQLEQLGLDVKQTSRVILTHGHIDHVGGLEEIADHCSPQVFINEKEAESLKPFAAKSIDYLKEGDVVRLAERDFTVIHTPGHTVGSVCLYDHEILITGDTVFPGGYFGRTDLPTGDWSQLIDSLERLAALEPRVMFPGHGEPLFSDAASHVRLSKKTAHLVRY